MSNYLDKFRDANFIIDLNEEHSHYVRQIQELGGSSHASIETLLEGRFDFKFFDELESQRFKTLQDYLSEKLVKMVETFIEKASHNLYANQEIKDVLRSVLPDLKLFIIDYDHVNACTFRDTTKIFVFSALIDKYFSMTKGKDREETIELEMRKNILGEKVGKVSIETLLFDICHELGHIIYGRLNHSQKIVLTDRFYQEHFCDAFSFTLLDACGLNLSCIDLDSIQTKTYISNMFDLSSSHPSDCDRADFLRKLVRSDLRSYDDTQDSSEYFYEKDFDDAYNHSDKVTVHSQMLHLTLVEMFPQLKFSPFYSYSYRKTKEFYEDVLLQVNKFSFVTSSINYDTLSDDVKEFFDRFYDESIKDNFIFFKLVPGINKRRFTVNLLAIMMMYGKEWENFSSDENFPFVVDSSDFSDNQQLILDAYFAFLNPVSCKESYHYSSRKILSAKETVSMVRYFNSLSLSDFLGLNAYYPGRPVVLTPSFALDINFTELPLDEYLKFFHRLILIKSDLLNTCFVDQDPTQVFDENTLEALFTIIFAQDTIRHLGLNDESLTMLFVKFHNNQKIDVQKLYEFLLKDCNLPEGASFLIDFYETVCEFGYIKKFEMLGYTSENSIVIKTLERRLKYMDINFDEDDDYDDDYDYSESDLEENVTDLEIRSLEDLLTKLEDNQFAGQIFNEAVLDYFFMESSKSDFNFVYEILEKVSAANYIDLYCWFVEAYTHKGLEYFNQLILQLREKEGFNFDDYFVLSELNQIFLAIEVKKVEFIEAKANNGLASLSKFVKNSSFELYKFLMENIRIFAKDFDLHESDKEKLAACLESLVSYQYRAIANKDGASLNGFERDYSYPAFLFSDKNNAQENKEIISKIISELDGIFLDNISPENLERLFLLAFLFAQGVPNSNSLFNFSFKILSLFIEKHLCLNLEKYLDAKNINSIFDINYFESFNLFSYMFRLRTQKPVENKYVVPVNELFLNGIDFSRKDHVEYLMYILPVQRFLSENQELSVEKIWSTDFPNWIKETLIYKYCNVSSPEDLNCVPREDMSSKLKVLIKAAEYENAILKIDNFEEALNLLKETFKYPTKHRDAKLLDLISKFSLGFTDVKDLREMFTASNTNFDYAESVLNSTLGHYLDAMNSVNKYKAFMALFQKPTVEKENRSRSNRTLQRDDWFFHDDFHLNKFTIHAFNLRHNPEFIDWFITKLVSSGRPLLNFDNTAVIVERLVSKVECDLDDEFEDFIIIVFQLILINSHNSTAIEILSKITKKILTGNCSIEDVIKIFLESFGVSGIKLAQVLSSQNNFDPIYDNILSALSSLKENVSSINLNEFIATMDREFEHSDRIQSVKLLNSGSIGSVWEVEINGEIKILKLKKPNVGKFIAEEKATFEKVLNGLKKSYPESDYGFDRLIEQVFDGIAQEADFNLEIENLSKLSQAGSALEIGFPVVDRILSNQNMIFMSKVPGVSLESLESIPQELKSKLLMSVFMMAVQSNVVHGDLHAGNVFVDLETNQISIIDCGLVVEIQTDTKLLFMGLFNDLESSVRNILRNNSSLSDQEIEAFMNDIEVKESIGDKLITLQSFLEKNNIIISSNFDQVLLALIKMSYLIS